jgi:hypothetical protein
MKAINSILIILAFSILISCSENDNDFSSNLPYFEFKNEDTPNLLNLPKLNSRLTFINQNSEELYFDVMKSESGRQLYSRGNWVYGSTKYYYFDEQSLYLRSSLFDKDDTYSFFEISIRRVPVEFDWRVFPVILSKESRLITNIRYVTFNNKGQGIGIEYRNLIEMNFLNKNYKKVIKVDLTKTEAFSNNWPLPSLNYIYFDINEGIIGFDDRNGNEWRLK